MIRDASSWLDSWLGEPRRKPLVVRGARQVGKTWIARDLAQRHGLDLLECNFERDPRLARCFESGDPTRVLDELALVMERAIDPATSLLFLDEIQAAGEVLARLRWFAEELPELPVLAAGSLLEFTLADHAFSMPVGRISYLHLEPMTYPEYLKAHGQEQLVRHLREWRPGEALGDAAADRARDWFARYLMVGGLPGVVLVDVEGGSPRDVRRAQHDLVATYRDDFTKYAGRVDPALLDAALRGVAAQLGRKFVYSHVEAGVQYQRARRAFELLVRARVCHLVAHTAAHGIPLGAEVKERNRKAMLLDVGLAQALLGTPARDAFPRWERLPAALRGPLVEQVIGQHLRAAFDPWEEPRLYYWQKLGGRPSEVDFVVQVDDRVVPLEIKSGASGSLKSLHQFVHDRGLSVAVRCDANPPSVQDLDIRTTKGQPVRYRLISLPHFLAWRLHDTVRALSPAT